MGARQVILWGYKGSPFVHKVEHLLLMKFIPYLKVEVPLKPPRPELLDVFGIGYRKVPVLAIGREIYCDTALIADVLERRFKVQDYFFPALAGPGGRSSDRLMTRNFSKSFADETLFELGGRILPWEKLPDIKDDRMEFFGERLETVVGERYKAISKLQVHLTTLEDHLATDKRNWIFNTCTPSLADITAYAFLDWMSTFRLVREQVMLPTFFPYIQQWLHRMKNYLAQKEKARKEKNLEPKIVGAQEAAEAIKDAGLSEQYAIDMMEAARWGLKQGHAVSVVPQDKTRIPTTGRLMKLNFREVIVETQGSAGFPVHVHFPRAGYDLLSVGLAPGTSEPTEKEKRAGFKLPPPAKL